MHANPLPARLWGICIGPREAVEWPVPRRRLKKPSARRHKVPAEKNSWGCSSVGRAPRSQRGGHRFDPGHLHHCSCRPLRGAIRKSFVSTEEPRRWGWVVLHGALAAPSRPQSAIAGWNASYEVARMAVPGAHVAMKVRSCATRSYEPRQDRKVAAVSNRSSVPQGSLAGAVDVPGALEERSRRGARPIHTAGA